MNRFITVYRGSVTTGKELTEVGIKPKYIPQMNHRWYENITDYSLQRISTLLTRLEPKLFNTEILNDSVYLTFKIEGDKLLNS